MPRKIIHITEEPEIKKLKRGGFSVRFRIPAHGGEPSSKSGWRKYPELTTKGQAKRAAAEYREELEDQINDYTIKENITFGEYGRRWHENRKGSGEINDLTYDREEIIIKSIEESSLAEITLLEITTEDIDRLKAENIRAGYSQDKQRRILSKIKQILKFALSRRRIKYDPSAPVKNIKRVKQERRSLTEEQQTKLLEDINGEEPNGKITAVRLAFGTGFRRGECLGLQWGDIHFKERYIDLQRQLNSKGQLVDPKQGSKGKVPLDKDTLDYLKRWKKIVRERFYEGKRVPNDAPVCCNESGRYLGPSNFDKWRRRWFVEHGLGTFETREAWYDARGIKRYRDKGYNGYNLHELRHTMATELLGLGTDLRSVQGIMRHSKTTTTAGYVHAIPDNITKAIEALGNKRKS